MAVAAAVRQATHSLCKFPFAIKNFIHFAGMQQQVQKVLAKKKQEKQPFLAESHVDKAGDKPVDNIEKCNFQLTKLQL